VSGFFRYGAGPWSPSTLVEIWATEMGNSGSPLHIQTKDSHSPVPLLLVISTCQLLTRGAREDLLSPEEAAAPPRANALRTRMDPLSVAKQERVVIVDRGSPTEHCVFDCKQWKRKGTALTVGVNGKPAWETGIRDRELGRIVLHAGSTPRGWKTSMGCSGLPSGRPAGREEAFA
jgi:hypothetical protein